ncbi:MAG TPA: cysteine desulfurase-like protein [Solirubrobacteraceae bacterium]|nr:cysteine desulfurase-like protein [Solirubrobacteraceae bacterium]
MEAAAATPLTAVRARFPGLRDGWARLDGPAGTQMVDAAIDAMAEFMRSGDNANHGGVFRAAEATDELTAATRAAVGRLLGGTPEGVAFGPSMSALTMRVAAAVGRTLAPGDEIACTRLDHDANVAPWLIAADRAGATVRFADPEPETLELPASAVEAVLGERTRWVAVTAASNAVGTVPDLPGIVAAAHAAGARVYVDAVHAAPHRPLDVGALGVDALACSAYKWFGPHVGILWGRPDLLEELQPDKLRPSPDEVPDRWELGTLPFEGLAGVRAAAEFMLSLDRDALRAHEDALLAQMLDGLRQIDGVTVHGAARDRAPTVMFSVGGHASIDVARALAADEVAVWHGNYYAVELARHLGLERHGSVRAGAVAYTDQDDVRRLLEAVSRL